MSRSPTSRELALDVLVRVERGAYSNVALPVALRRSGLEDRDRAFVTDLVYGTLREQRTLDWFVARVSSRSVDALDPAVRAAVRLGAYQLRHGVAPHAAVSATVDAAGRSAARSRGFVNAVLRALARAADWSVPGGETVEALGVRTSHPDWIVAELVSTFGRDGAERVLDADNLAPAVTLRVRRGVPVDAVARELATAGADVTRGRLVPEALVVRGIGDPATLPAVAEGRATPQDQASQSVVALVGARSGERMLEVAAAPGGKATGLAESVGPEGHVVALDVHPARLALVAAAARRLALANVSAMAADGRALPVRAGRFDRVLLDAPCSGLGVLRRRAEARWRVQRDDVQTLASLQRDLLRAASGAVRPGGRLVYSVCTLTRAETLGVDEWAGDELLELDALEPPGPPWRPWGRGAVLMPDAAGTDGMFVLVFERR
ncbi:MAG: 16S rRNA (cytosine(967)-C(5))-methyltransferase RsmB [Acidimicrobiia bacterium]